MEASSAEPMQQSPVAQEEKRCHHCDAPAHHVSPKGFHYCDEHNRCIRGHVIRWRKHMEAGIWVCACYWGEDAYEQATLGETGEQAT